MIFRLQLVHKKDIHSWSINVQTDLATGITAFLYYSPSPPRSLVIHIGNEVSCCVPSPIPQNPHHQQHYLGLVRFILRVKTHHIMYLPWCVGCVGCVFCFRYTIWPSGQIVKCVPFLLTVICLWHKTRKDGGWDKFTEWELR